MKQQLKNDRFGACRGWLASWLLGLLLSAAGWPAAYGQGFSVRVTPNGSLILPPGGSQVLTAEADYPGFASGVGFDGPVYALARQADGKVLAGGSFTTYNGTARGRLARVNADGTLDASFAQAGAGLDGPVRALAVQADGKVLVGGEFTHYGSAARSYLLRLNADGSLDSSFAPGAGPDAPVAAIVVQPDGRIFVGGSFQAYAGVARSGLARVLAGGGLDASFQTSYASTSSPVLALALQADGRLLVGGSLSSYSPTGTTTERNYIARFSATGTLDAAFAPPQVSTAIHPITTLVTAIVVQPDGKILLGVNTRYIIGTVLGGLRRLNPDGTSDVGYSSSNSASSVSALALQADGKILVGGYSLNDTGPNTNVRRYYNLYRLNASGTFDTFLSIASGYQQVYSLVVQPTGKIWLGGDFTVCNGLATGYYAVLNPDGTFGLPLNPVVGATYTWSTGATGPTIVASAPAAYVATATANGQSASSVGLPLFVTGGTYRLHAGGGALDTKRGPFLADGYYSASSQAGGTTAAIAGTLDPALFQSERYSTNGTLSYTMPVVNGTYQVVLYFAEIYWTQPGQRVFNISLEGQTRLTNYDIVKKVGPRVATSEIFTVSVTDGVLNLDMRVPYGSGGADQAKLSALEVLPAPPPSSAYNQAPYASAGASQALTLPAGASTTTTALQGSGYDPNSDGSVEGYRWAQVSGPTTATLSSVAEATPLAGNLAAGTYVFSLVAYDNYGLASPASQVTVTVTPAPYTYVLRVNVGSSAIPTTRGDFYADKYLPSLGARGATSAPISGTPDPELYQSERYSTNGALRFAFDMGNGDYQVVLHFAEIYWTQPGQRVFDVSLEGSKVLSKFDIVQKVGPLAADIESFPVTVTDGVLNLDLVVPYGQGGADQAKLSAFEIYRLGPAASTSQLLSAAAPASPLSEVRVFPNPTSTGRATLACVASQGQAATLTLTDALGRQVRQQAVALQAGANQLAVEAAGLAPGFYQLGLVTADGQRHSQKLVIQP